MNFLTTTAARTHGSFSYRADIDGLRAIAVLSVIAFHMNREALPGGYLGVDIFFVISGYLITGILRGDVEAARYSIVQFYDRRIRRIMPALFAVLAVTTAIATAILLPGDLIRYGKSLLATLGFVANIHFWRESGYFDPIAETKPLLHMWSLGVEEQFYIVFPLMLAALARHAPRAVLPTMATITAASLALNVAALALTAHTVAFYLLPPRAWELGAGALLALLPGRNAPAECGDAWTMAAAACGAALVAVGLVNPHIIGEPVPDALLVVAGTVLLIRTGRFRQRSAFALLSAGPLVFVGLISYSLYLWHWPALVFARYYAVRELYLHELLGLGALMLALALLSWRFIERPFRERAIAARPVWLGVAGGAAAFAACGIAFLSLAGMPWRMKPDAARINAAVGTSYRCPVVNYLRFGASRACVLNLPSRQPADADLVLVGNSHAQMYAPLWEQLLREHGQHGLLVPINSCLPTVSANISVECLDLARVNLALITALARPKVVVLAMTWDHGDDGLVDSSGRTLDNARFAALIATLDDLIDRLRAAGKRVVVIGPIVEPLWDVPSELSRSLEFGRVIARDLSVPRAAFEARFAPVLSHFGRRDGVSFARADRMQCIGESCHFLLDGRSLFADNSHIAAAELPRFRAEFERAWETPAPMP